MRRVSLAVWCVACLAYAGTSYAQVPGHPPPCGEDEQEVPIPQVNIYRYEMTPNGPFSDWVGGFETSFENAQYACEVLGPEVARQNHSCPYEEGCIDYRPREPYKSGIQCQIVYTRQGFAGGHFVAGGGDRLGVQPGPSAMCVPRAQETEDCVERAVRYYRVPWEAEEGGPPWKVCIAGCEALFRGGFRVLGASYSLSYMGRPYACVGVPAVDGPTPDEALGEGEGEGCSAADGLEFCAPADNGPENCGFLNDEYVCLGRTRETGCQALGDGSRVCGSEATAPPAPDSGTPGVPAQPDGVIEGGADPAEPWQQWHYFDPTTVEGSSRDPDAGGEDPYGRGGGVGGGDDDIGDGGIREGLICDEGEECEGDGDGGGDGGLYDDVPCYADVREGLIAAAVSCGEDLWSGIWSQVQSSDLITLITSLPESIPQGECPSAEFVLWGEQYDFAAGTCQVLEQHRSLLSLCFLILYSFVGVRILLSIPGGGD